MLRKIKKIRTDSSESTYVKFGETFNCPARKASAPYGCFPIYSICSFVIPDFKSYNNFRSLIIKTIHCKNIQLIPCQSLLQSSEDVVLYTVSMKR